MVSVKRFLDDLANKIECLSGYLRPDAYLRLDKSLIIPLCEEADEFAKELRTSKDFTELIKQEALKMLPTAQKTIDRCIYRQDRLLGSGEYCRGYRHGFNNYLEITEQNISNYTIERSGE